MSVSQQQPLTEAPSRRPLTLPFLDSEPLLDVQWAVLLLPIWWWLGIEQFIWPVLFGWAALKLLYRQRLHITISPPLRWFAVFLVAVLFSSLFIVEMERWFTYVRNLGAFTAGFFVLLIIANRARSWKNIEKTLDIVLIAVLIAGSIGLLAIVGIWRPYIYSLVGSLLPAAAANTGYGQTIVIRTLGDRSWFLGLGDYFRVSGLFLFSNSYSSILVYAIPFLFYKLGRERRGKKFLLGLGILLLLVNLVYTTGRVATIALLAGAIFFALFHSHYRRLNRVLMSLALSFIILLILLSTLIELSDVSSDQGVVGYTAEAINSFVFARGSGSFTSRFGIYGATLESFAERPLFGWGTERDHPVLELPLGSHSEFMAVLYRQGLFGSIAFIGLLWSVWKTSRPPSGAAASQPPGTFLRYGRWFFVTSLINSLMTDPAVDSSIFVLQWLLIALLLATTQLIYRQRDHAF